jgi:hypothetical protein
MHAQDTALFAMVPAASCSQFVFSLPNKGSAYEKHLERPTSRFRGGNLCTVPGDVMALPLARICDPSLLFLKQCISANPRPIGVYMC